MYCTDDYTKSTVHQEKLFCYFLLKSIEREYSIFHDLFVAKEKKRLSHKLVLIQKLQKIPLCIYLELQSTLSLPLQNRKYDFIYTLAGMAF